MWGTKYVFFIIYRCWIFYHRTIWDKKINNKKTCNNILNLKWYDWYLFESNVRRGGNGIRFFGRVHHSSISYKIRWDFYENQHEFSTWIFQFLQLTNYISMEKIYLYIHYLGSKTWSIKTIIWTEIKSLLTKPSNIFPFYTSSQNSNLLYSEVDFLKRS